MPAYRSFDNSFSTAPASPAGSSGSSGGGVQQSTAGGFADEYGGLIKSGLSKGGFTGTGVAEGYNKVYDFATGFKGAPGTNLATGTSSSGTFGGSNIANAAYGYAGGKLANELFDNKGFSDIGGTVGASLGGAAAVGGTAAAASMGAQFGAWAGPVGALAGAVLGSAIGSLFGGKADDYRFRTYSGELGNDSQLNIDQINEKRADWDSIGSGQGESYDRWKGGDYSKNTSSAYKWLKEGNTFSIGDKYTEYSSDGDDLKDALDNDYASYDGPFGKYTVGHVDDIPGRTKFAQGWVDSIGKLDAAVASILTPEQIEASKQGLIGSIQGTPDWRNKSGQNFATDAMIADRYAVIFELAGRGDLAQKYTEAMDRSKSGVAADDGVVARAITELQKILQGEAATTPQAGIVSSRSGSRVPPQASGATQPAAAPKPNYTISRPEGVIASAVNSPYTDGKKLLRMSQ